MTGAAKQPEQARCVGSDLTFRLIRRRCTRSRNRRLVDGGCHRDCNLLFSNDTSRR
jgi:hypothetical protein